MMKQFEIMWNLQLGQFSTAKNRIEFSSEQGNLVSRASHGAGPKEREPEKSELTNV